MKVNDGLVPTSISSQDNLNDKFDAYLAGLITASSADSGPSTAPGRDSFLSKTPNDNPSLVAQASGGYVTIDTTAADGDGAALLKQLEAIGLQSGNAFGAVASGVLSVSDVPALLGVADLGFAQAAASSTSAAQIPPQFSNGVRAGVARSTDGVDGTGVTVGILSDSFNESGDTVPGSTTKDDEAYDIANGYLPASTKVLNDAPSGTSMTDEGRAMAQIVHQVAPGASILFDTAEGGQAAFAQHILDLAAAGAKVIVDDISYFAEPDYQNGVIAQAIKTVEADGVTYLSSAGNDDDNGYEGAFKADTTFTSPVNNNTYTADQFGAAPGAGSDFLPVTIGGKETVFFELQWDQPAASASTGGRAATSDLDVFLTDSSGNIISNLGTADNNIGHDPSEVLGINFSGAGSYGLKVGLANGSAAPSDLRIIASGDGAPVSLGASLGNPNTNEGTLAGHHGQEGSSAVGAVYYANSPAYGTTPPVNETYSSGGVDNVDYADDGTPKVRQVNNVTFSGIDGGDTSFFYPGDDAEGDGLPNFFGTSAAAPTAAAVAALMLQANPSLTPPQIQQYLAQSAIPTSSGTLVGGSGLIQADVALALQPDAAPTAAIPQTYTTTPGQVLSLKNTGISVADTDGQGTTETATLTVGEGVLTATAGTSGATVAGSGTGTLVINGTVAQIDAFLDTDATSTLGYSDAAATSARNVALTLTIDDNASPVKGGPKTGSASSTIAVTVPTPAPTPTPAPVPTPAPTPASSPTIAGTHSTVDAGEQPVLPFGASAAGGPVKIGDTNAGATDSLTITLTGGGGTLSGAGLTGGGNSYSLAATDSTTLSNELDALTFTPTNGTPGATVNTTFALAVASSAGTSATDGNTVVADTAAPAPTPTPTPVPTPTPTPIPVPDAVSLSPQVTYANGVFSLTGTASSPAGVRAVEITAQVDGVATDLGAATVDANGNFSFKDAIGAHTQGFITATETDNANGTAAAQASYSLTGGLSGGKGRQDRYTADGSAEAATDVFKADGSQKATLSQPGQTFASSFFDTFNNGGAPESTFVFNPGFGRDVVSLFRPDGTDHDTLSFKGSDYGNSIATVLASAKDTNAGLLITDPTASSPGGGPGTHDTLLLKGITKDQLAQYQTQDITFHA